MGVIASISQELQMPEAVFRRQINEARGKIKHIKIPKKNKRSFRKVYIPPWEFKIVQYWLIYHHLKAMPVHRSCTAFKPGSSIRDNALRHLHGHYFVKMDLADFFPSLGVESLRLAVENFFPEYGWLADECNDPDFSLAVFYNQRCAIGYPASPYLSNVIMYGVDQAIEARLKEEVPRFGRYSYTRYADDITISIDNKGFKKDVVDIVKSVVGQSGIDGLSINREKTKFGSKSGGSAFITGMRICPDGHVTLHRKYKDHVRLLMSLFNNGKLDISEKSRLEGHLNYCKSADPDFYNKLAIKYFSAIDRLKEEGR